MHRTTKLTIASGLLTVLTFNQPLAFQGYVNFDGKERFFVEDDRIVFAGQVPRAGDDNIDEPDVKEFIVLARSNPNIKLLEITSYGGYVPDALNFAHAIADMNFDTVVPHTCESACVFLFIAGNRRTLEPGARLGFHGTTWTRSGMKSFFNDTREENGWLDEMAFAAWIYQEAMRDQRKELKFFVERGVDIIFALRSNAVDPNDMWYPSRKELEDAGVITNSIEK